MQHRTGVRCVRPAHGSDKIALSQSSAFCRINETPMVRQLRQGISQRNRRSKSITVTHRGAEFRRKIIVACLAAQIAFCFGLR